MRTPSSAEGTVGEYRKGGDASISPRPSPSPRRLPADVRARVEAQACRLPVIGGAGDGTRDALADGQLGVLVDPDRGSELCEAIEAALDGRRGAAPAARFDGAHFQQHVRGLAALLVAPDA